MGVCAGRTGWAVGVRVKNPMMSRPWRLACLSARATSSGEIRYVALTFALLSVSHTLATNARSLTDLSLSSHNPANMPQPRSDNRLEVEVHTGSSSFWISVSICDLMNTEFYSDTGVPEARY